MGVVVRVVGVRGIEFIAVSVVHDGDSHKSRVEGRNSPIIVGGGAYSDKLPTTTQCPKSRVSQSVMPQFLITALGSYGDVHPMIGLGTALAARGHVVKVVTNPYFEEVVTGAGLEFLPLGTREEYIRMSEHPDIWHPTRGPRLVVKMASVAMLRPLYERLIAHYVPGETVFCAHCLDLASRVASEKLGAPVANIVFAPAVLWAVNDSPRLKGAFLGPRVPRWLKQLQFSVGDKWLVQMLLGGELNRFRRELDLEPVRRIYSQWLFARGPVLGLFPDWFAAPQPDWPPQMRVVGFPLWDSAPILPGSVPIFRSGKMGTDPFEFELNADAREFLAAGARPIAFSPGSANRRAHQFFEAAVEACDRLGCRGILLTKYDHQLPSRLPDSVRHFGFVPLSKLLPHTAALVHHGGIGTCAQGLAAGLPHVVQPMSYDQFDNSRRLVRLGVAAEVPVRQFRGRTVADALVPLLDSPTVAARCRELAARCNGPAAMSAACDVLEQLANSHASCEGLNPLLANRII
jgi:UDP:flavonoid glycosyltransferase YjiC (YdhE family)